MSDQYYYRVIGQDFGPVTLSALQLLFRGGQLGSDAQIRRGSDGEWMAAGRFDEVDGNSGNDSSVLEEISDLSEIDADYSGDSHVLSGSAVIARGDSGTGLSKSTIEINEEKTWFCQVLGQEFGPLTMDGLRKMVEASELSAGDLVRSEDQTGWAPASMLLGELFPDASMDDLFASAPDSVAGTRVPSAATRKKRASPAGRTASAGDFELADSVKLVEAPAPRPAASPAAAASSSPSLKTPAAKRLSPAPKTSKPKTSTSEVPTQSVSPKAEEAAPVTRESHVPASPASVPPGPMTQTPAAATHAVNRAPASLRANKATTRPRSGGGFSMPDIPVEGLLKLVGVVAVCAAAYFAFTLLPSSMDLPETYVRMVEIYNEFEQLPDEGAERKSFIAKVTAEVERLRTPLSESMSASNLPGLELNFTAGALLVLLNVTDKTELEVARANFLKQVAASHFALTDSGVDASQLPTIESE